MPGPAEGGRQAPRAHPHHHRSHPVHPGATPKKSSCSRTQHGSLLSRERKDYHKKKKLPQEQLKSCSYDLILHLLEYPMAGLCCCCGHLPS